MDNYEVFCLLGEGCFGRVYKAKQLSDSQIVALKVISKRGRSSKELKGLRRECEIQRHLHHPNIIQMLGSFETESEIVVITEFAHKQLNLILAKEGYLPEKCVQKIVWDLVSALYYLHSHRVLHRDLKPQNILLDSENCAKLCDFGFARNMSTGTHVLTSIKGTPLYMAPELIEESPYDHNADLWSLGCIIYELLVGAPPFCTTSILHLIRLIRYEQIQWPGFMSENCTSFLKGLLQKNPSKRMTWPEILEHAFVKGHVVISDNDPEMPLTRPLSANTLQAKEKQTKYHLAQKNPSQVKAKSSLSKNSQEQNLSAVGIAKSVEGCSSKAKLDGDEKGQNVKSISEDLSGNIEKLSLNSEGSKNFLGKSVKNAENKEKTETENKNVKSDESKDDEKGTIENQTPQTILKFDEDLYPIENEEWIVFLQRSIDEVMNGEMTSLCQQSLTNILVSPLRNSSANSKVIMFVAKLFSLPFVVREVSDDSLSQIKKMYLEVKLVPNLVYSVKLLMRQKNCTESTSSISPSPANTPTVAPESYKAFVDISDDDLSAVESVFLLICHLVHLSTQFLTQFCDAIAVLNIYGLLQGFFLLSKRKLRIVCDLVAILSLVLQKLPENHELINQILLSKTDEDDDSVNYVDLLRHSNSMLQERMCYFFMYLAKHSLDTLELLWDVKTRETLEALAYDSVESVRNAAEFAVEELKQTKFY